MVCANFLAQSNCSPTLPSGMTETSTVVLSTAADDIWFGSSGSILPAVEVKILSIDGIEFTGYNQPGELVVKSPSTVLGYLNNDEATRETFQDGWVRTGDEAVVRVGPKGTEHVFIVDRIKELIKVKVRTKNESFQFLSLMASVGPPSRTCRA